MRFTSRLSALFLLAAACGSLLPSSARAWWNSDWPMRKKLTVDLSPAGAPIADPVGTAVVLIRLHDSNFQFANAKSDGSDLRFVAADDKTLLPFQIEKYDALLDEAFIWVQLPDLKAGETRTLWLYSGNANAPAAADSRATYDAETVLVYHFTERGQPPRDAGLAGNDATSAAGRTDGAIAGPGLRLDGRQLVSLPASPSLAWTEGGAMTWSAWVKPAVVSGTQVLYSRHQEGRAFLIGLDHGAPYLEVDDAAGVHRSAPGHPLTAGQWRHWAVTAGGDILHLYLNGEAYAELAVRLPALATASALGGDTVAGTPALAAGTAFSGDLDELELSRIARPAGFVKFAAYSQGGEQSAKLLTLGEDEQRATWLSWLKSGYFGIILNSLTLDGWVVIGLLFVMAIVSWVVMIRKAMYLTAIARGNELFMREWHHLAADLTVLDHGEPEKVKTMGGRVDKSGQRSLRAAPIYRIYHIGTEEIRRRLASNPSAGARELSARSIQAIRASIDGGIVRETQRLNSGMVLLTIAISGGPFLGLLGTVVGVMITFAAIAAAGDVNVNAIAPGIAAALVATVAGLAVAIPSLFGYNYLLSRVKDATSDMHVFLDEFVTKMAEFYSEPPR